MRAGPTVAAAWMLLLAGCDTRPGPTEPGRLPSGVPTSHPTINGPRSVAPGATAQFRLVAAGATGSTQDVSRDATWMSAPWVYEHLAGGLDFTLEGHASATYAAGRFDGVIDGRVRVFTNGSGAGTTCEQVDHHWRLERMLAS